MTAALLHLSEAAEQKKQEWCSKEKILQKEIQDKNNTINILTESCSDIITNIDSIINQMDKVLDNNGASYSNNK